MPVQDWTLGQILTAVEMTTITNMLPYATAQTGTSYDAIAGDLVLYDASGTSFGGFVNPPSTPSKGDTFGVIKTDTTASKPVGVGIGTFGMYLHGHGAGYVFQYDGANWQILTIIPSQWTTYTPTWTDSTTNPVIGNGTIAGWFRQTDVTIDLLLYVKAGSTTTFGTGTGWKLTLPLSASGAYPNPSIVGTATIGSGTWIAQGAMVGGLTTVILSTWTAISTLTAVTATSPGSWASASVLQLEGTYIADITS